jgi:hypothetical protein
MIRQVVVLCVMSMFASIAAGSESAWWVICDSCESDSEFASRALNAPGSYALIYVSNRGRNETRKFQRWTSFEDFEGGIVQRTEVSRLDMDAVEKGAFRSVIQDANTHFQALPRSALDMWSSVGERGSAVQEIASGTLSFDFLGSLRSALIHAGLFPTERSINLGAGKQLKGISVIGQVSSSKVRQYPLRVRVFYEDGSRISVTLSADASTWSEVTITDRDGNELHIRNDSGRFSVDPNANDGRDFRWGGGPATRDAIVQLTAFLDTMRDPGSTPGATCMMHVSASGTLLFDNCRENP